MSSKDYLEFAEKNKSFSLCVVAIIFASIAACCWSMAGCAEKTEKYKYEYRSNQSKYDPFWNNKKD